MTHSNSLPVISNNIESEKAMKTHQVANVISAANLELKESLKAVWTGGLTASVSYALLDIEGKELASTEPRFNRNPGTYRKQGTAARAGTARHAALDKLLEAAKQRLGTNNEDYAHVIVLDACTWTVFGTGTDEASALADAAHWNEGSTRGLACYRATEAAYEYAKRNGGKTDANALDISERPNRISLAA